MAAPAFVAGQSAYAYANSVSLGGVTVGNLLVVFPNENASSGFTLSSTAGTVNTKADGSGSSGWTKAVEKLDGGTNARIACFWAYARSSGTHTVQHNGSSDPGIMILEYSGVADSSPVDNTSSGGAATGNYETAAFDVADNCMIVFGATNHQNGRTVTPYSGYTERIDNDATAQSCCDRAVTTGGSFTPGETPSSTSYPWAAVAVSFKGTPDVPSISGLSLPAGTTAGGTSVVISGSNFSGATAVTFGGTNAASYTVDSAKQITATTPAHAAGSVQVQVTTALGSSENTAADDFLFVDLAGLGVLLAVGQGIA